MIRTFRETPSRKFSDRELLSALNRHDTPAAAARALGVSKQYIYKRIRSSGLLRIWIHPEASEPKG